MTILLKVSAWRTDVSRAKWDKETKKATKREVAKCMAKGPSYWSDKCPHSSRKPVILAWQCNVRDVKDGEALQKLGLPIPPLTPILAARF